MYNPIKKARILLLFLSLYLSTSALSQPRLHQFNPLPQQWDEAIPLGNGMIGLLIWEKNKKIRFALDRKDLWDSRPMNGLHSKEFSYQ